MSQSTLQILVVDDEPDLEPLIRQGFRPEVQSGKYAFSFASDGTQALNLIRRDLLIDLVLTDLSMPNMDGLSLLSNLIELDRVLKAVVITAYGDMENIRKAMNQGAFDFLTKPLSMEDLKTTVRKAGVAIQQQKKAELVRQTFGRYVSDEVATILLDQPGIPVLGGEKRRITLLMSDLRGFSMFAKELAPEEVLAVLNIYLGRMTEVITEYNGTIVDFIGDAILALFGAPFQRDDDASRAVACAIGMQCAMDDVNIEISRLGLGRLEMGIGIHTGEVVVGNIGSLRHMKYGAVGSHVNLTSRIESFTVGGQVLTTEDTLTDAGATVLVGKEMRVSAKGFSTPIKIYVVEGIGPPYDLALPVWTEHLVELDRPWSFVYEVLDGKRLTGNTHRGVIEQLSTTGAVIRTEEPVELLSNLRVTPSPPSPDAESGSDFYAKVLENDPEVGVLKLRFTAIPQETYETIRQVCAGQIDVTRD